MSPSFKDPSADVVLVSSDGIEFPVMRGIMIMASPIFRDMFLLPQSENSTSTPTNVLEASSAGHKADDNHPRITLTEDSNTLDHLLCVIYPVDPPKLGADADAEAKAAEHLFAAAVKYEMKVVINHACSVLIDSAISSSKAENPSPALRLYAIACRHSLKDFARKAAWACLHGNIAAADAYMPEFDDISANTYLRLIKYQRAVSAAVVSVVDGRAGIPNALLMTFHCLQCCEAKISPHSYRDLPAHTHPTYEAEWWKQWVTKAKDDIATAPLSESIYSSSFAAPVYATASKCDQCITTVPGRLAAVVSALREKILDAAKSVELDLTGV